MCNPYAYGALLIAQGYANYMAQEQAYEEGQDLEEENKKLAEQAYDLDIAQINKRQDQEEEAFELSQRQLEKKNIQEGVDATVAKRRVEKEGEKAKGKAVGKLTANMLSGNTVDAIIADYDQQMLERTGDIDLNRDRSKQMIAEQRGINTRNLAMMSDQLKISKLQAKAKMQDRIFSFRGPSKPDPLTALLGAGSAGFQSYQYGKNIDYKDDYLFS
tara:strand:- start:5687 stop:6334 length:648 start_codon:yes stop_codon:yes gene_type:complete